MKPEVISYSGTSISSIQKKMAEDLDRISGQYTIKQVEFRMVESNSGLVEVILIVLF